jgi:hypothetical protein
MRTMKSSKQSKKSAPISEKKIIRDRGRIIQVVRLVTAQRETTTYGPPPPNNPDEEEDFLASSRIHIRRQLESRWERGKLLGVSISGDAWKLQHGESARRGLQRVWKKPETRLFWASVQHLRMHADEFFDFEATCSDGRRICDVFLRAIESGNTQEMDLLAKVIEEVAKSAKRQERNWRVAQAVKLVAKRTGKPPTSADALTAYLDLINQDSPEIVDYTDRTFREALAGAGFGWLLAPK